MKKLERALKERDEDCSALEQKLDAIKAEKRKFEKGTNCCISRYQLVAVHELIPRDTISIS